MTILINFIFFFTIILFLAYVFLGLYSSISLRKYTRKNSYVNYNDVAISPLSPNVSIIIPAYNEEKTIIDNVLTLIGLHYSNFEAIVVNDGSNDNTLELLKQTFNLEKVDYYFDYNIPCEKIRGIYKSNLPKYKNIMVIDKENGGCKSDALNAALNVCKNDLIITIDADSIIEPDSIVKLVKPFLEEKNKKVIGTGGVIRILNSCEVEGGRVKKINLPSKFLPKLQVLEYTRAFLLGRMAWSELDGLMLISGAMGMFDRKTMIECGGFDIKSIGEDMDMVLKMRAHMAENKKKYIVTYIPDPLCWTQVPSDYKSLSNQRTRWSKGLIDCLIKYRKMFLNPKYGKLGMLGYPFWLIFEWIAPIIALLGMVFTICLIATSSINWLFFLILSAFIYSFSIFLSTWSVLYEELTFHKYRRKRDVFKLILVSIVEPFLYFLTAWFAVKGNVQYLLNRKNKWGKIYRQRHTNNGRIQVVKSF